MAVPAANTKAFVDLVKTQINALWADPQNRPPAQYPADTNPRPGELQDLPRQMSQICGPPSVQPATNQYWKVYIWPEDVRPAAMANIAAPYKYYDDDLHEGIGYSDGMNFYLRRWLNPPIRSPWDHITLTWVMYKLFHQANDEPKEWSEEFERPDRKEGVRARSVETPFANNRLAMIDLHKGIALSQTVELKLFSLSPSPTVLASPMLITPKDPSTGIGGYKTEYKNLKPPEANGSYDWQRFGDSYKSDWQAFICSRACTEEKFKSYYDAARRRFGEKIQAARMTADDAPMNVLKAIATFIRNLNFMQVFPGGNERTNIMLVLNALMLANGFGLPIGGKHRAKYDLRALRWICCGCFDVDQMAKFLWLAQDFGKEEQTRWAGQPAIIRQNTIFS